MWEFIGTLLVLVAILVLFGLVAIGAVATIDWCSGETEKQRVERRRLAAEREIQDISRQAQSAILNEAVRRAQEGRGRRPAGYPNIIDGEWEEGSG